MEIKKELSQMTGKAAGAAIEVQHGMEAAWLARSIKQELDTGISMEAVITGRLPTMDTALVQEDVSQLMQGIQSLRESTRQTVNVEWVRQHLNDALCNLDTEKRVAYLRNLIEAIVTAYPACAMENEAEADFQKISDAENHTDADVTTLLDILTPLLPQMGELLQRSTVKAMLQRMDQIDHAKVAQKIDSSENAVAAYAAACYIMQKRGKQIKVKGQTASNIPAFTIGAATAASVESSKVVELYQAGKLTLEETTEKVNHFFTAVVTYACESVFHALALGLYVVTTGTVAYWIVELFVFLGAFMYFSPVMLCVAATLLAVGLTSLAISVKDCEDLIHLAWDLLRGIWDKIASLWHETVQPDNEGIAEAQEEVENESEIETEDEDEDQDEEQDENDSVDVFA